MSRKQQINAWIQQRTTAAVNDYIQRYGLSRREAAHRFDMKSSTLHSRLSGATEWTVADVLYAAEVMNVRLIP